MTQSLQEITERYFDRSIDSLEVEEQRVLTQIREQKLTSRRATSAAEKQATLGERLADRVAAVGGSWGFIIAFGVVLFIWMLINTRVLSHWAMIFDPYPFVFLNLMLSLLAAIQAPVIMMSQNRQAAKDRLTASLDFEVNLRAELEILRLHNKIDHAIVAKLEVLAEQQAAIARKLELSI